MNMPPEINDRIILGEQLKSNPEFESIIKLIGILLGEDGCPWDKKRKLEDCPKYLSGELNELIDAIKNNDSDNIKEELGDLLFMVAFTAKLAEREGLLSMTEVFQRILNKMVFRHPHVFGDKIRADSADDVVENWKMLKQKEKDSTEGSASE